MMANISPYVWIVVFVLIAVNAYFIICEIISKETKVCPICGGKMRRKKKCKISDKGHSRYTYYIGTFTTYMFIRGCTNCDYEIWPENMVDRESWHDAD